MLYGCWPGVFERLLTVLTLSSCSWGHFPPTELPPPVVTGSFVSNLIVSCYVSTCSVDIPARPGLF